jgi:hypothetical protein
MVLTQCRFFADLLFIQQLDTDHLACRRSVVQDDAVKMAADFSCKIAHQGANFGLVNVLMSLGEDLNGTVAEF